MDLVTQQRLRAQLFRIFPQMRALLHSRASRRGQPASRVFSSVIETEAHHEQKATGYPDSNVVTWTKTTSPFDHLLNDQLCADSRGRTEKTAQFMWEFEFLEQGNRKLVKSTARIKKREALAAKPISTSNARSEVVQLPRRESSSLAFELKTNVKAIREKTGLNQDEFARTFGIPLPTLQNWEQGRRKPDVAVCVLLHLIANDPKGVAEEIDRMKVVNII